MALSDEELESIEAAAAALPEAAATPIRALLAEVERLQDVLRGERYDGDDQPRPGPDTFESAQRAEAFEHSKTLRNLARANRWIAHLERELHARGGPAPRIADLVDAQGGGELRPPSRPPSVRRAPVEAPCPIPRIAITVDGREMYAVSTEAYAQHWGPEVERELVERLAAALARAKPAREDDG